MSRITKEKAGELRSELRLMIDAAKAANRDLTDVEAGRVDQIDADLKARAAHEKAVAAAAADLDVLGNPEGSFDLAEDSGGHGGNTPGRSATKGRTGSTWAKSVQDRLRRTADRAGVKSLLTGQVAVPPVVEIVDLPLVPTRLLDLVVREALTGNNYAYLRQTVRTTNADVVADLAVKPTSVYTFQEIDERARVVAHLSEPFPLRFLEDYAELSAILDSQMVSGVLSKVEQQIVAGTGVGEQFTGILTASGVNVVPFTTSILTTIRKARTALENKGETPNAWVLNPLDIETLDLMRENGGGDGGFLMDAPAADMLFGYGIARVPSLAVPAGTALLADWSQIKLKVRSDAQTLAATQAGNLWATNGVVLRSEGRYGVQLRRPSSFAVVRLAA